MKPLESYRLLSQATKHLATKRSEVHSLWDKWVDSLFLQFYATRTQPELVVIIDGDKTEYLFVDHESRVIRQVAGVHVIDGGNIADDDRISSNGDNNEHLQKDPQDPAEQAPGGKDL